MSGDFELVVSASRPSLWAEARGGKLRQEGPHGGCGTQAESWAEAWQLSSGPRMCLTVLSHELTQLQLQAPAQPRREESRAVAEAGRPSAGKRSVLLKWSRIRLRPQPQGHLPPLQRPRGGVGGTGADVPVVFANRAVTGSLLSGGGRWRRGLEAGEGPAAEATGPRGQGLRLGQASPGLDLAPSNTVSASVTQALSTRRSWEGGTENQVSRRGSGRRPPRVDRASDSECHDEGGHAGLGPYPTLLRGPWARPVPP